MIFTSRLPISHWWLRNFSSSQDARTSLLVMDAIYDKCQYTAAQQRMFSARQRSCTHARFSRQVCMRRKEYRLRKARITHLPAHKTQRFVPRKNRSQVNLFFTSCHDGDLKRSPVSWYFRFLELDLRVICQTESRLTNTRDVKRRISISW